MALSEDSLWASLDLSISKKTAKPLPTPDSYSTLFARFDGRLRECDIALYPYPDRGWVNRKGVVSLWGPLVKASRTVTRLSLQSRIPGHHGLESPGDFFFSPPSLTPETRLPPGAFAALTRLKLCHVDPRMVQLIVGACAGQLLALYVSSAMRPFPLLEKLQSLCVESAVVYSDIPVSVCLWFTAVFFSGFFFFFFFFFFFCLRRR
jgi:hypothetical protein